MHEHITDQEEKMLFQSQANLLKKRFEARRINFYSCNDEIEAISTIKELIRMFKKSNRITNVGYSDSVTLHQINAFDEIKTIEGLNIINPLERNDEGIYSVFGVTTNGKLDLPKEKYYTLVEKVWDKMRESLLSDIFILGANAITMAGQIVSTDGTGNRVGGMIFGPKRVIIVVGKNKLCSNLEHAITRNRNVAAPLNYHRHNIKHHNRYDNPCMKTGVCVDCNSPRRACLKTVIFEGEQEAFKDRTHLIFVNRNLGL